MSTTSAWAPGHRKDGIGAALMSAVRHAAEEHGVAMALDMWSFNEVARAFFRSQGFEAYNERMWWREPYGLTAAAPERSVAPDER